MASESIYDFEWSMYGLGVVTQFLLNRTQEFSCLEI